MADPRQRNAFLIIFGLMLCAMLLFLILDFMRTVFSFKNCAKRPRKEVTECWGCWGRENCKTPFRQICTEEWAADTHNKILQYWEEDTDEVRTERKQKTYPKDDTGRYIIFNKNAFKCLSIKADYRHRVTNMSGADIEVKGCVYKEFTKRHMNSNSLDSNNYRDYYLYDGDDDSKKPAHKQYVCSADLCNNVWGINDIARPRTRRFFEGRILTLESNPKRLLDLNDD